MEDDPDRRADMEDNLFDAELELQFLVGDLRECLVLVDVDDMGDDDFTKYRRRDLVRRARLLLDP